MPEPESSHGLLGWFASASGLGAVLGAGSMWGAMRNRIGSLEHRVHDCDETHKAVGEKLDKIADDVSHVRGYIDGLKKGEP